MKEIAPGIWIGQDRSVPDPKGGFVDPEALLAREQQAEARTRSQAVDFLDQIDKAGCSVDSPVSLDMLRAFLIRRAIGLAASPKENVSLAAIQFLAKVQGVDLLTKPPSTAAADQLESLRDELKRLYAK